MPKNIYNVDGLSQEENHKLTAANAVLRDVSAYMYLWLQSTSTMCDWSACWSVAGAH